MKKTFCAWTTDRLLRKTLASDMQAEKLKTQEPWLKYQSVEQTHHDSYVKRECVAAAKKCSLALYRDFFICQLPSEQLTIVFVPHY